MWLVCCSQQQFQEPFQDRTRDRRVSGRAGESLDLTEQEILRPPREFVTCPGVLEPLRTPTGEAGAVLTHRTCWLEADLEQTIWMKHLKVFILPDVEIDRMFVLLETVNIFSCVGV